MMGKLFIICLLSSGKCEAWGYYPFSFPLMGNVVLIVRCTVLTEIELNRL